MQEEGLALGLTLDYLGNFSLNSFNDRIIVQKKIYCAQMLGIDFGFSYNWYLRGPYSPELTSLAFETVNSGLSSLDGYELSDDVIEKLNIVKDIAEARENWGLSEVDWLELVCSVHYLIHEASWIKDKSKENIAKNLFEYKPKYDTNDFNAAWSTLDDQGLIGA